MGTGKTHLLCTMLALCLMLAGGGGALAERVTLTGEKEDYSAHVTAVAAPVADNPLIAGENPLTGEPFTGEYKPVMVVTAMEAYAYPLWGVSRADWFFELPTRKDGTMRALALYLGEIPEGAGPVHSTRIAQASLRDAFDAALVCWGVREAKGTSVKTWAKEFHRDFRVDGRFRYPIIDLIDPDYASAFTEDGVAHFARDGHRAPFQLQVDVAGVQSLAEAEGNPRAYRFSDTGTLGRQKAERITLLYDERTAFGQPAGDADIRTAYPVYAYDAHTGLYSRLVGGEALSDGLDGRPAAFANVILLRTRITWEGNQGPVVELVGQGACDLFTGGTYQRGTWVRAGAEKATESNSLGARLLFLDEDGKEWVLRRGSTAVVVMDNAQEVVIETAAGM